MPGGIDDHSGTVVAPGGEEQAHVKAVDASVSIEVRGKARLAVTVVASSPGRKQQAQIETVDLTVAVDIPHAGFAPVGDTVVVGVLARVGDAIATVVGPVAIDLIWFVTTDE